MLNYQYAHLDRTKVKVPWSCCHELTFTELYCVVLNYQYAHLDRTKVKVPWSRCHELTFTDAISSLFSAKRDKCNGTSF